MEKESKKRKQRPNAFNCQSNKFQLIDFKKETKREKETSNSQNLKGEIEKMTATILKSH